MAIAIVAEGFNDINGDGTVSLQEFSGGSRVDLQSHGRQQRWPPHPGGDPGFHTGSQETGSETLARFRLRALAGQIA